MACLTVKPGTGCLRQPMCCSLRPTRVSPDVVTLVDDAVDYRAGLDRCWELALLAQQKLLSELPALRAAAARDVRSSLVLRNSEEFFTVALEQVSDPGFVVH